MELILLIQKMEIQFSSRIPTLDCRLKTTPLSQKLELLLENFEFGLYSQNGHPPNIASKYWTFMQNQITAPFVLLLISNISLSTNSILAGEPCFKLYYIKNNHTFIEKNNPAVSKTNSTLFFIR